MFNFSRRIIFNFWYNKDLVGNNYETKTEIACYLIGKYVKNGLQFTHLVADGLYFNKKMVGYLTNNKIKFEMRAHANRVVNINGSKAQLKHHSKLKLLKNNRNKVVSAMWHDFALFFSVHKRYNRNNEYVIVYQVSTIDTSAKNHLNIYVLRWNIEKMFRTMKQQLGLEHCTARNIEKQSMHISVVFYSYSFLQHEKKRSKLPTAESVVHKLRNTKLRYTTNRIVAFGKIFQCFA